MGAPGNTAGDVAPSLGARVLKETFNRMVYFAFREMNIFRGTAQIKNAPQDNPMPGNPVTFTKIRALATNITPISETADPAHKVLEGDPVSITLAEYGDSMKATKKLRLTSFADLDLIAMREAAAVMEESVDLLARNVLNAGTNVLFPATVGGTGTTRATIAATDVFTAKHARYLRAKLRGNKAPAPVGMEPFYWGAIHPDVSYDFQQDTGTAPWKDPQVYREDVFGIFTGEIGAFGGIRWVESANVLVDPDAGALNVDAYVAPVCGFQALGEAIADPQHIIVAGPFDDLQRFLSIGWYFFGNFGRIREESLYRYEVASSIGANA
jgi:N4-gp56 family major capsid protein